MGGFGDFDGSEINVCEPDAFASGRGEVIIVSGNGLNFCGHALLNVVGYGFLHVSGKTARPRLLRDFVEFERYISANRKMVLSRFPFDFPFPDRANHRFCQP